MSESPNFGPPVVVGFQKVRIVEGYPFFAKPQPNPAQIGKQGVALNGTTIQNSPVPAFVPATTHQLVDGADSDP